MGASLGRARHGCWGCAVTPSMTVPTIDVATAASQLESGDSVLLLLDVREEEEWRFGHAPGSVNIPLSTLPSHVDTLDRSRRIICVCRSGNRSAKATEWLRREGFDAVNLVGGMNVWSSFGHPVVRFDGREGTVI
jgi:rhodanese-related sulfurtransferase